MIHLSSVCTNCWYWHPKSVPIPLGTNILVLAGINRYRHWKLRRSNCCCLSHCHSSKHRVKFVIILRLTSFSCLLPDIACRDLLVPVETCVETCVGRCRYRLWVSIPTVCTNIAEVWHCQTLGITKIQSNHCSLLPRYVRRINHVLFSLGLDFRFFRQNAHNFQLLCFQRPSEVPKTKLYFKFQLHSHFILLHLMAQKDTITSRSEANLQTIKRKQSNTHRIALSQTPISKKVVRRWCFNVNYP